MIVYHKVKSDTFPKGFIHVADVNVGGPPLSLAYTLTIHKYSGIGDWKKNKEVTPMTENPRSTTIGDVIQKEGEFYKVTIKGFEKII